MAKSRANIFGDDAPEIDLSDFAPKAKADAKAPSADVVKAVAETANFRSREITSSPTATRAKRPARRYRTGRNVQFSVKAQQETVDEIYAISDAKGWVLGYTLERAIAALRLELDKPS